MLVLMKAGDAPLDLEPPRTGIRGSLAPLLARPQEAVS